MRCIYLVLLASAAALVAAGAESPEIQHGRAVSPLSWQEAGPAKPNTGVQFAPQRNVLGISKQASSVKRVVLRDERPYGEGGRQTVWLARFESVPLQAPDGNYTASVTLSLAFDIATSELLCAFTDQAPQWARSPRTPEDIEAQASKEQDCTYSQANYGDLQSTVMEVLRALWVRFHVDPSKVGQIVIRPRYAACRLPAKEINGELVSVRSPSNVWIVEVLGSVVKRRGDWLATTLVAEYSDTERKMLGGLFMD